MLHTYTQVHECKSSNVRAFRLAATRDGKRKRCRLFERGSVAILSIDYLAPVLFCKSMSLDDSRSSADSSDNHHLQRSVGAPAIFVCIGTSSLPNQPRLLPLPSSISPPLHVINCSCAIGDPVPSTSHHRIVAVIAGARGMRAHAGTILLQSYYNAITQCYNNDIQPTGAASSRHLHH